MTTFVELEQEGWQRNAASYDEWAGTITSQVVKTVVADAKIVPNMDVLDVACGPGYGAGAAAENGARASGVDFSSEMVDRASRAFPHVAFRQGDAQKLPYADGVFDAVICLFGMLHFADPDRAIAEAWRVLRPGGRYLFTVWAGPEENQYFALTESAIRAHGTIEVGLPSGPPKFRFCDQHECQTTLTNAGFDNVAVTHRQLVWHARQPQDFVDLTYKSSVRTHALLDHQEPEMRDRIHQAIRMGAAKLKGEDGLYRCAWPAIIVSAQKR